MNITISFFMYHTSTYTKKNISYTYVKNDIHKPVFITSNLTFTYNKKYSQDTEIGNLEFEINQLNHKYQNLIFNKA